MEPVVETILVVDDDKINRNLLSIILRNEGYQVVDDEERQREIASGILSRLVISLKLFQAGKRPLNM